jgi:hypothetical protein
MTNGFDSAQCDLMSRALHQALERLTLMGLVNGNADAIRVALTRSILQDTAAGERDEEALVMAAIAPFQVSSGITMQKT